MEMFVNSDLIIRYAVANKNFLFFSKKLFTNEKERDIIRTHMFPVNLAVPKYAESWLVSLVDKVIGLTEFTHKFGYKFAYAANVYLLFFINNIK